MFALRYHHLLLAVVLVPLLSSVGWAGGSRVRLESRLAGRTLASGKAKFEMRADRVRFSAEIEDAAPGALLTVVVRRGAASGTIGSIGANAFGFADFNLDSRLGQGVPALRSGDRVEVWTGGRVLISGTLR